jgi:glutamate/tyrosine decarboxylase-like PLP-dependent enzyme
VVVEGRPVRTDHLVDLGALRGRIRLLRDRQRGGTRAAILRRPRRQPGRDQPGFNLYDLADRLRIRGWQVPAYSMPAHREDLVVQRILVRNGVSRDLATLLLDDFRSAIAHLSAHPSKRSLGAEEAGGFHH